jgi:hypothetical protein
VLYRRRRGNRRYLHGDWRETDGAARRSVCLLIPGAITPVLGYLLAIVAGTLVAGLSYAVLKRPEAQQRKLKKRHNLPQ